MKRALFSSPALLSLVASAWRRPSRCPYCPGSVIAHWILWGFYWRYDGNEGAIPRRIAIQRYLCNVTGRTFSLLPDCLLPFHFWRTGRILRRLYAMVVEAVPINTLARLDGVNRAALQQLKRGFLSVVSGLRLPHSETALKPAAFLADLAAMPPSKLLDLFRDWKELEPKHSVLGIYRR